MTSWPIISCVIEINHMTKFDVHTFLNTKVMQVYILQGLDQKKRNFSRVRIEYGPATWV